MFNGPASICFSEANDAPVSVDAWSCVAASVIMVPCRKRRRSRSILSFWVATCAGPCLVDTQALFHRITLVPNKHVETAEPGGPLRRHGVYALRRDAIDKVVEISPWIAGIEWIERLPRLGTGKRVGGRLADI